MLKKTVFALSTSLILAACAEQVTQAEQASADYGAPVSQATCEQIAKATILPLLRDPTSPLFQFSECRKEAVHSIPIAQLPKQYGYGMRFTVNAKNGFGGYAGPRPFYILIKDGKVIRRLQADDEGLGMFPF